MKAADTNVNWKQYGNYSGPVIQGVDMIEKPSGDRAEFHVDRAFWLTTMVETGGKIGAIMAADGTAMTAGLDQHIAVYPRELAHEDFTAADDQGTLWKLLRRLETVRSSQSYHQALTNLWRRFEAAGWYVAQDGLLRYLAGGQAEIGGEKIDLKAGDPVFGSQIREEFTPNAGKVPASGKLWERSRAWALAFHELTSHVGGEAAQIEFGIEHLVKRTKRRTIDGTGNSQPIESFGYLDREITSLKLGSDWTEEIDLAMCMYQAHSVNAPAVANAALEKARDTARARGGQDQAKFARILIEQLGNSTFGRWDDDIEYGRYQRTRTAARASELWSRGLFDGALAIMPKNLAG